MHHSARVRKQKSLKILCFVICVEDYHKLTQTQFLIQSPLGNLTSMLIKTSFAAPYCRLYVSFQSEIPKFAENIHE